MFAKCQGNGPVGVREKLFNNWQCNAQQSKEPLGASTDAELYQDLLAEWQPEDNRASWPWKLEDVFSSYSSPGEDMIHLSTCLPFPVFISVTFSNRKDTSLWEPDQGSALSLRDTTTKASLGKESIQLGAGLQLERVSPLSLRWEADKHGMELKWLRFLHPDPQATTREGERHWTRHGLLKCQSWSPTHTPPPIRPQSSNPFQTVHQLRTKHANIWACRDHLHTTTTSLKISLKYKQNTINPGLLTEQWSVRLFLCFEINSALKGESYF